MDEIIDKLTEITGIAEQKAADLSAKMGVKVLPIIFKDGENDEYVVGYIKEPNRMVKAAILDKSLTGQFSAAAELLNVVIIKEASDPRITSEASENDKYFFAAALEAFSFITISSNLLKKK